jgi:hypothetical protein
MQSDIVARQRQRASGLGLPADHAIAYSIFRNLHRLRASLGRHQVDRRSDRGAEGQSGQVREEIKKNIATMGARADYGTPEQFSDFVQAETVKFASIIEKEGLQMEVK